MSNLSLTKRRRKREWWLIAYAREHEDTLLALALSGTKRKKRRFALCNYGTAIFLLRLLYGSRRAVAERLGMSVESVREWMICGFGFTEECKKVVGL